jgi:hypothetical protein
MERSLKMSVPSRAIVPGPNDVPFERRPYGRLRLFEDWSHDLLEVIRDEYHVRSGRRHISPLDMAAFRRMERIRENLEGMMREKGWLD